MFETPVLILIFNRPDTTEQLFQAIQHIQPTKIYIAADGPRTHVQDEAELCLQTKTIFDKIDWKCEIKTLYRTENLGCCNAVKGAIDWFFENEEKGIILEDDCIPNNSFFIFCDLLLKKYEFKNGVMQIAGSSLLKNKKYSSDYFFSHIAPIWGWATWRRAWCLYEIDIKNENNNVFNRINNIPVKTFYKNMFDAAKNNTIDTWDIQWQYTILKNNGVAILPTHNLIKNIGFTGTHSNNSISKSQNLGTVMINTDFLQHPTTIKIDHDLEIEYLNNIQDVIESSSDISFFNKAIYLLKKILKRI